MNASVIGAPELGSDEKIPAMEAGSCQAFLDAFTDFLLVAVNIGTVDMPVA